MKLDKNLIYSKTNSTGNVLDNQWLLTYNDLKEFQPNIVKIFKIKNNVIYMENLNKKYPHKLIDLVNIVDNNIFQNLIKNYFNILTTLIIFGNERKFFHNDLNLSNFLSNNNGDLILIDPESFVFLDPINEFEIRYKMLESFRYLEQLIFKRYKK